MLVLPKGRELSTLEDFFTSTIQFLYPVAFSIVLVNLIITILLETYQQLRPAFDTLAAQQDALTDKRLVRVLLQCSYRLSATTRQHQCSQPPCPAGGLS